MNNRPVAMFDESESEPTVSISLENLQSYKEIENWYNLGLLSGKAIILI